MEKKTIGSFISTLRKEQGMTQRDLAERVGVSDKTISRWERDEGYPDLSTIPLLADIFNVSCDELLRGEKDNTSYEKEESNSYSNKDKREEEKLHLLKCTLSKYQTLTYISLGISGVGLAFALVCNFAFLNAILGFFLGLCFFIASFVCQIIFTNKALFRIEDINSGDKSSFKRRVIKTTEISFGITIALIGFISPLALAEAYTGLKGTSLLLMGTILTLVFLIIYSIILYFFNASLVKKCVVVLSSEEGIVYHYNHHLKRILGTIFIGIFFFTMVLHLMLTELWGPSTVMEGETFTDYESFISYMEEDVPYSFRYPSAIATEIAYYYDENGNEISEEEALTKKLTDKDGNIVCTYVDRNHNVVSIQYSQKEGTILPITVFTLDNLEEAKSKIALRHIIFSIIYSIEVLITLVIYTIKRKKLF